MDALSVLRHEIGHLLGIADGDAQYAALRPTLEAGTRLELYASALPQPQAAPAIDWQGGVYDAASAETTAPAPAAASSWLADFVGALGKSKAEREPNAGIKIAAPVSPKVTPEVTRSARVER